MIKTIGKLARRYSDSIILFVLSICILSYGYLTAPAAISDFALPTLFRRNLPGDFPRYVWRFLFSFLFLGVIPVITAVVLRKKRHEVGCIITRPLFYKKYWYIVLAAGIILFTLMNAYSPNLYNFYPFSQTLITVVEKNGVWPFLAHGAAYLFLFYIPWEISFRGMLILPFVYNLVRTTDISLRRWETHPRLLILALLQTIPSTLLHVGHPYMEALGAVAFGILMAIIVLRTRSIMWPIIIHFAAGIMMDLFIILRRLEVLP